MLLKLLETTILFLTIQIIATIKVDEETPVNVLEKLLLDPKFNVDRIAIWSFNQRSELQKSCVKFIVARGFPMTLISDNWVVVTKLKFDMLIIFMNAGNLVCEN